MQCASRTGENAETLVAYAAGQLENEAAALVERHLEECPSCREMLDAQRRVWEALEEWQPEPVSSDFNERLCRRIETEEGKSWWRQLFLPVLPFSMRPALPLAAACLLLVAALLIRAPADMVRGAGVETVDIEKVERALEDLEMLYVLDTELAEDVEGERTL